MNNTLGTVIKVTLFGESHGKYIGAVLDGLPAMIPVKEDDVAAALMARRPSGNISTARREADRFEIVSGVFRGMTNGAPLCVVIPNEDAKSGDYGETLGALRPGHSDFTSHIRNLGHEDFRGGGHFSGRLTAPLVALGAIVRSALEDKGIYVGTHVLSIADVSDRHFESDADVRSVKNSPFPVLTSDAGAKMKEAIEAAKADGDSVGGTLETAVTGLPVGVGEPWFGTVEGQIAYAAFSIPAVKAIEFGLGFDITKRRGSEANDPFVLKDGRIRTETNNCGGVLGGLTTGGALLFRTAVKPTPTIVKEQKTVDISSGCETVISSGGRHDPCVVHRAASVQSAVAALVVADMYAARFGAEALCK